MGNNFRDRCTSGSVVLRFWEEVTTGSLFNFPATLFLVQSYGLYVDDARGAILVSTRPTCYVPKHTMVYDEGE